MTDLANMPERTYRVLVRGRFANLDERLRASLLAGIDGVRPKFTVVGSMLYDRSLHTFTYRYEIRVRNDTPADSDAEAVIVAEEQAKSDLAARGIGYRNLTVMGATCLDEDSEAEIDAPYTEKRRERMTATIRSGTMHRQWVFAERPVAAITARTFAMREALVPEPGEGEALVRVVWLGIDPTQRTWLNEGATYLNPVAEGDVMRGSGVG
ncbi:MAG: DUF6204 family protein [Thermomicrobiales bacterium]